MSTYGETLRDADADECPHGEPRGAKYCALCRGVRSNHARRPERSRDPLTASDAWHSLMEDSGGSSVDALQVIARRNGLPATRDDITALTLPQRLEWIRKLTPDPFAEPPKLSLVKPPEEDTA